MSVGDRRLVRPERLSNWEQGRGKLTPEEADRLALISSNASLIEILARKNESKRSFKVNRSLRDWIANGKGKGVPYKEQDAETRAKQQAAIKALRFLGIDPSEGTFYVRKRKG
jgi:DNA-binding CsgD family transcriptional regulator